MCSQLGAEVGAGSEGRGGEADGHRAESGPEPDCSGHI